MIKNLIPVFFFMMFIYSCKDPKPEPNVRITGIFPELSGKVVILEELEPVKAYPVDSAAVASDGVFEFNLSVPEAGFYLLRTSKENNLLLLLEGGQQIVLSSHAAQFEPDLVLEGSPGSMQILEFEKFMRYQQARVDSLANVYNANRGQDNFFDIKKVLDSMYLCFVEDQRSYIFQSVDNSPGSLANLIFINRRLGQTEVIDEEKDFQHLYRMDSMLQLTYPGNKHTLDHHERVKEIRGRIFDEYVAEEKLRPGKRAPDVILSDTAGRPVSLKSFTGKQVILYFWAGWDAKSRQENRRLVTLYPELKANNTEVLGISLDEHEKVWKGAIRLDQLQWTQLSELKGFYSNIRKAYNIPEELPYFYLIDEHQKIKYKHRELDSLLLHLN